MNCTHRWNESHTAECDEDTFACHNCFKVLKIREGLSGRHRAYYCSETCQLQSAVGEHFAHKALRLGLPLLERIAVALEKLTTPPEDPHSAFLSTCSFCGATPFMNNTGHHPKCTNPDRR